MDLLPIAPVRTDGGARVPTKIGIDLIRADASAQMRIIASETVVNEYADAINDGAEFPPIVVFFDSAVFGSPMASIASPRTGSSAAKQFSPISARDVCATRFSIRSARMKRTGLDALALTNAAPSRPPSPIPNGLS
jgi:hypothetical protein